MNLKDRTIKIVIGEPWNWNENLIGIVLSNRENDSLLIKLSKPIKGKEITSDLMKLRLRYEGTSFEPLLKKLAVTVGGALINESEDKIEYIIIGSLTLI